MQFSNLGPTIFGPIKGGLVNQTGDANTARHVVMMWVEPSSEMDQWFQTEKVR